MLKRLFLILALSLGFGAPAMAAGSVSDTFSVNEIVITGGEFVGSVSQGLASVGEKAVSQFGLPNGYILGEEGSGAFVIGARFGEGTLYTRNKGDYPLFWQGPSIGIDIGGDGSKVMMLVYNLKSTNDIFNRIPGDDGHVYVIGGLGMTLMKLCNIVVVPIRSGVGLRSGVNVGYLHFTDQPTCNPIRSQGPLRAGGRH